MMNLRRSLIFCVMLATPPLLPAQASRPAEAAAALAWRDLMAAAREAAPATRASRPATAMAGPGQLNAAITAAILAAGDDVEKIRQMIAADTEYEPLEPGWRSLKGEVADGDQKYELEYRVRVPKGYDHRKSWPVLVAAHGQHGDGREMGRLVEMMLREQVESYIVIAPTMPGPAHFNARLYQAQAHTRPLAWAKRNLNCDDDRIYVTGYSQGGHMSWHLAVMFPHLWAAAVPMAGAPTFDLSPLTNELYLENLRNLPVWAIWGEKDGATPPAKGNVDFCRAAAARLKALGNGLFTGTELEGVGHSGCFPKRGELARFLQGHKRQPIPATIRHSFHQPSHGESAYVRAITFARPPLDLSKPVRLELPPGARPDDEASVRLMRQKLDSTIFRIEADLDRNANSLTIRADGVRKLRLEVLDGMFDPSRPVTIKLGGKTWKGRIEPSARCILTRYVETRDATRLVLNEFDLDAAATTLTPAIVWPPAR